jgi:AhpD family alkylhydroperoxidase
VELGPPLRELVNLRASQINGCAYCIDMHTKDARAASETSSGSRPSPPGATRRSSTSASARRWHSARP